jgi:hypothetical protein
VAIDHRLGSRKRQISASSSAGGDARDQPPGWGRGRYDANTRIDVVDEGSLHFATTRALAPGMVRGDDSRAPQVRELISLKIRLEAGRSRSGPAR